MKWLTVSESATAAGKSEQTIRRLIEKWKDTGKVKQESGRWYLSSQALADVYPLSLQDDKAESTQTEQDLRDRVAHLEKMLDRANERQKELIQSLRIEQVKTLSDSDKRKILESLSDGAKK
jgi:acyl-CoA reductase-like NAD-dependent aldehyde dehydrogenase